jgi:hypothetical protein
LLNPFLSFLSIRGSPENRFKMARITRSMDEFQRGSSRTCTKSSTRRHQVSSRRHSLTRRESETFPDPSGSNRSGSGSGTSQGHRYAPYSIAGSSSTVDGKLYTKPSKVPRKQLEIIRSIDVVPNTLTPSRLNPSRRKRNSDKNITWYRQYCPGCSKYWQIKKDTKLSVEFWKEFVIFACCGMSEGTARKGPLTSSHSMSRSTG